MIPGFTVAIFLCVVPEISITGELSLTLWGTRNSRFWVPIFSNVGMNVRYYCDGNVAYLALVLIWPISSSWANNIYLKLGIHWDTIVYFCCSPRISITFALDIQYHQYTRLHMSMCRGVPIHIANIAIQHISILDGSPYRDIPRHTGDLHSRY